MCTMLPTTLRPEDWAKDWGDLSMPGREQCRMQSRIPPGQNTAATQLSAPRTMPPAPAIIPICWLHVRLQDGQSSTGSGVSSGFASVGHIKRAGDPVHPSS
mmetsp:Transcript_42425/g.79631  ORF Transcript_42425/g.79631 Transcript_42425/m.79631 type:complete len:101 (+) Transcript_42425:423-725(+)